VEEKIMKRKLVGLLGVMVMLASVGYSFRKDSPDERRSAIHEMRDQALEELYKLEPEAERLIAGSAGYAVFENKSLKIAVAGSARGKGIVVRHTTGEEIFMKMAQVNVGLGLGLKNFRVIFVFQNQQVLDQFITKGWDFGGQANASAADKDEGGSVAGAVSVAPGLLAYQFTEKGLSLEVTLGGTKYWKDKELNAEGEEGDKAQD
jgi:lipid-binding SYLF domain-containing protein